MGNLEPACPVLCQSRRYLPLDTLKTLYNSHFLPYINCSLIWASTYASYLKRFTYFKRNYSYNYFFPSAHILACEPQTYFRSLLLFLQKKRQPEIRLKFAGYAHPLSPFFLSIIFFDSTLSINSMFPVLYSYILIAFCLILFPRSYILILNITII